MDDQLRSTARQQLAGAPTLKDQLLSVWLDSWDRANRILLNLLRSLPPGALRARALADSPTVAQIFVHLHHERMISVFEEAPEYAGAIPGEEWADESDPARIEAMLIESGQIVRNAVEGRILANRQLDRSYDHPSLLLQLLLFHESYHHGQIKLACKAAGTPIPDDIAGPLTWGIWRKISAAKDPDESA